MTETLACICLWGKTPLTTAHMTARTRLLTGDMHRPCTSSRLATAQQGTGARLAVPGAQRLDGAAEHHDLARHRRVHRRVVKAARRRPAVLCARNAPCPGYTLIHGTHWRDVGAIRRSTAVLPLPGTACPLPQLTTQNMMHCMANQSCATGLAAATRGPAMHKTAPPPTRVRAAGAARQPQGRAVPAHATRTPFACMCMLDALQLPGQELARTLTYERPMFRQTVCASSGSSARCCSW